MGSDSAPIFKQRLSAFVRARLLFKREVEIDGVEHKIFVGEYLQRLIGIKERIDHKVSKLLTSSIFITFVLYLAGAGIDVSTPLWGLRLSQVPGVLVLLSFASSYTLAISAYAFMNSQMYAALIDQVVLEQTDDGLIDPELVKCAHQEEWLIFKALRKDFSYYFPVYIEMGKFGELINRSVYFLMATIATSPFIVMIVIQPYLSCTLLPAGWAGLVAQAFSLLCAISVACLVIVAQWDFECSVDLKPMKNSQPE